MRAISYRKITISSRIDWDTFLFKSKKRVAFFALDKKVEDILESTKFDDYYAIHLKMEKGKKYIIYAFYIAGLEEREK